MYSCENMWSIVLLSCVSGALATAIPFIKTCPMDDTACVIKSTNDAIPNFVGGRPEMGIPPLEPMFIKHMASDNAGLKLVFTDNYVKGMSTCLLTHLKSELQTKSTHTLTFKCPHVEIDGDYRIDGKLLLLAIQGQGKFKIDSDVVLKVSAQLGTVTGADGKPHFKVESWKNSFKVQTSARFNFENLFNGNKVIAEPIIQFMNENWKEVLAEAGMPIHQAITQNVIDVVQKVYDYAAKDEVYSL